MAFTCSSLIRFTYQLFFLAVVIWASFNCQGGPPKFVVKTFGSPVNFTCPGDTTKNYTFTFFHKSVNKKTKVNTVGNDRIKQDKSTLIIIRTITADAGSYYCEVRNQAGGVVFSSKQIVILFLTKVQNYDFTMSPKAASSPVDEGDTFTFTCVYAKGEQTLKWWRVGSINTAEIPRGKITVLGNTSESKEQYVIKNVTLADSGAYRCEVMENKIPKFTSLHVLKVIRNKKPTFPYVHDIYNVEQLDENYEIDFELKGAPFPNLTCSREGKEIISCSGKIMDKEKGNLGNPCKRDDFEISDSASLIITNVYYSVHHGKYNCVATNIVGSANVTFTVNVTVWPTISSKNIPLFYQEINKEGTVTCTIKEANPRPVFKWYSQTLLKLNDNPMNDTWRLSNLKQRFNALAGGKFESILIVPADVKEWSFYMCNASNSAGFDTRVYQFIRFCHV